VVKCAASGTSTNRRGYTSASVQTGGASSPVTTAFNASLEVKPRPYLDLEFDYSCSVPLQLNNIWFGISLDLGPLMRRTVAH
jgi:hypothetical protein